MFLPIAAVLHYFVDIGEIRYRQQRDCDRGVGRPDAVAGMGTMKDADPGMNKADAAAATQRASPAAADPREQAKRLNRSAIAFFGLGIAAAAMLALLSWSERAPRGPAPPAVARQQAPVRQPAPLATSAALPLPIANPPSDRTPGGSEQGSANAAGPGSLPAGPAVRDAATDAAGAAGAIPGKADTGAATATVVSEPAPPDEPAQHKPTEVRRHSRASRIATAKQRPWHSLPPARVETNRGQCTFFLCLSWQARHVFYEPPRNVNQ
ncbi:MAG: hypothetical protein ACREET_15790 [Stellaceae bacterium]